VFLALPQPESVDDKKYRQSRSSLLEICCMVLKYKFPHVQNIVGIASEPSQSEYSSEDLIYFDARNWTAEHDEKAKVYQKQYNLFVSPKQEDIEEEEYPDPPIISEQTLIITGKVGRNEKCPCGSGKKYKHCHGKPQGK
jgi:preprotein translocase subunit SecA